MPLPGFNDESIQPDENLSPVPTGTQQRTAISSLNFMDGAFSSTFRLLGVGEGDDGFDEEKASRMVPIKEMNERAEGLTTFNSPMDEGTFSNYLNRAKQRDEWQQVANDPNGPVGGLQRFLVSAKDVLLDPVEATAGFLVAPIAAAKLVGTGVKLGSAAKLVARAGPLNPNLARKATIALELEKNRARLLKFGLVEGAIGAGIAEVPIGINANIDDLDYGITDIAASVALGTVLFPAARYGINRGVDAVMRLDPSVRQALQRVSTLQIDMGHKPDVTPVLRMIEHERYPVTNSEFKTMKGDVSDVDLNYSFRKIENPQDVVGRKFYVPDVRNAQTGARSAIQTFDDFDGGNFSHMSDAPAAANGVSGSSFSEDTGRFLEVSFKENPDLRFVDLDNKIDDDAFEVIEDLLRDHGKEKLAVGLRKKDTMKEVLEELQDHIRERDLKTGEGDLPDDFMDQVGEGLSLNGFHGYTYTANKKISGQNHNGLVVFDENDLDVIQSVSTDQRALNRIPDKEYRAGMEEMFGERAKSRTELDEQAAFDQTKNSMATRADLPESKKMIDDGIEEVKALQEQGLISEDSLDEINRIKKKNEDAVEAYEAAKFCVGKNG